MRRLIVCLALLPCLAAASELTITGTRFQLEGQPFPYTGVSFFNAIYNTNFNASSEVRVAWLQKFQGYGTPAVPPSGMPDPEFSPYHKQVFEFLKLRDKYIPK